MYNPRPNQVHDEAAIRAFVSKVGSGTLVTQAEGRIEATLLPIIWSEDKILAHFAKANAHAAAIGPDATGLWIVQGPEAYVSPGWYASKREHGRVVPTWNYSVVQLRGKIRLHDDPAWLRALVTRLTDKHEQGLAEPWGLGDAPPEFIEQQLRGIIGVEMAVESVEAKSKWSQNRSEADQAGVLHGLQEIGTVRASLAAEHMAAVLGER